MKGIIKTISLALNHGRYIRGRGVLFTRKRSKMFSLHNANFSKAHGICSHRKIYFVFNVYNAFLPANV